MNATDFVFNIEHAMANLNKVHQLHVYPCAYLRELEYRQTGGSRQINQSHEHLSLILESA